MFYSNNCISWISSTIFSLNITKFAYVRLPWEFYLLDSMVSPNFPENLPEVKVSGVHDLKKLPNATVI